MCRRRENSSVALWLKPMTSWQMLHIAPIDDAVFPFSRNVGDPPRMR